jgi:hypothetical protein
MAAAIRDRSEYFRISNEMQNTLQSDCDVFVALRDRSDFARELRNLRQIHESGSYFCVDRADLSCSCARAGNVKRKSKSASLLWDAGLWLRDEWRAGTDSH